MEVSGTNDANSYNYALESRPTLFLFFQGVGRDQPSMSDWITSLKLVDAEGNVKEYPKDAEGIPDVTEDEVMNTLRVPLGI